MKILVITSCTSWKKHKPSNQLKYEDFAPPEWFRQRTIELDKFKESAVEMYTGQQHIYLMDGLNQLRETYGQTVVDLNIISAGYGLLSEKDTIVPYNVTFQGLKKKEILERSHKLQIHEHVETLIADYDLVFFLLGEKYVRALQLCFRVSDLVTQIFLLGKTYRNLIPDTQNSHFVAAGSDLARKLSVMVVALKGFVFKILCEAACRDGFEVFEDIKNNPQLILDIVQQNS